MQRVKRSTAVAVLPADPVGGTPGYFPLPNPGGGVPAAVPGYEWYNNVQEELCAVILAGGLTLDGTNRAQLLAALRAAGVFTTPPQFDNTTKAATTAWIQARGMAYGSQIVYSSPTTIPLSSVGKEITITGAGTYSIPAAATAISGSVILLASNVAGVTIARSGADVFVKQDGGSLTSVLMGAGDTLALMADSSGAWLMVGGSVQLGYSASFGVSIAASGYQKLPTGLIVQWGAVTATVAGAAVTFPISFPTAVRGVFLCENNGNSLFMMSSGSVSSSGFTAYSGASVGAYWLALGN